MCLIPHALIQHIHNSYAWVLLWLEFLSFAFCLSDAPLQSDLFGLSEFCSLLGERGGPLYTEASLHQMLLSHLPSNIHNPPQFSQHNGLTGTRLSDTRT